MSSLRFYLCIDLISAKTWVRSICGRGNILNNYELIVNFLYIYWIIVSLSLNFIDLKDRLRELNFFNWNRTCIQILNAEPVFIYSENRSIASLLVIPFMAYLCFQPIFNCVWGYSEFKFILINKLGRIFFHCVPIKSKSFVDEYQIQWKFSDFCIS